MLYIKTKTDFISLPLFLNPDIVILNTDLPFRSVLKYLLHISFSKAAIVMAKITT